MIECLSKEGLSDEEGESFKECKNLEIGRKQMEYVYGSFRVFRHRYSMIEEYDMFTKRVEHINTRPRVA